MSSSSTHPPHSWDIKGYGGVYVCVSICLCVVEALKWDHRLNQAKAFDTHPPLINSPIRKHPHWQKHRWGPIDGCVIRRAGFRSIKKNLLHEHDPDQHSKESAEQHKTDSG